jgi:hypothetical protein
VSNISLKNENIRREFRVKQENERVLLLLDGRLLAEMPYDAANGLAKAIYQVSKRAEEWVKREQVADDAALLARVGAPFNLVNDPRIAEEALKRAQHDPKLRKYVPGTPRIESKFEVFAPSLRQTPPKNTPPT